MPRSLYVLGAILSEALATTALKFTDGFTRPLPSLAVVAGYGLSFHLLAQTLRGLEAGTVYAIRSAVGTVLIAAMGTAFLHESATPAKMLGIALVVAGVVLVNIGGAGG